MVLRQGYFRARIVKIGKKLGEAGNVNEIPRKSHRQPKTVKVAKYPMGGEPENGSDKQSTTQEGKSKRKGLEKRNKRGYKVALKKHAGGRVGVWS